jgi:hypothetical protein
LDYRRDCETGLWLPRYVCNAGFCIAGFPIQTSPYPPPPPAPPLPPATPATNVTGIKGTGNTQNCPVVAPAALAVGDLMIAFVGCFNELGQLPPTTQAGQMPPGWILLRDDYNTGIGSLHGPMYAGIATKRAVLGDLGSTFTWRMGRNPGDFCPTFVAIAVARGATGIGNVQLTALDDSVAGTITAAGCVLTSGNDLVFVAGLWGTGSGSIITSDSGLSLAMPQGSVTSTQAFYQNGSGAPGSTAPSQGLSCTNTQDAFSAYQVCVIGT